MDNTLSETNSKEFFKEIEAIEIMAALQNDYSEYKRVMSALIIEKMHQLDRHSNS